MIESELALLTSFLALEDRWPAFPTLSWPG
jgi:hypothetical protein